MAKFISLRQDIDKKVKENVSAAQERQRQHYDARHQQGSYKVGDLVLMKNKKKLSKKGDKMAPNWFGPYKIEECIGASNYRLERNGKTLNAMCNSKRLKAYHERGKSINIMHQ